MKKLSLLLSICILLGCAINQYVNKSEEYLRDRVVMLIGNGHRCSGEQVRAPSGVDYILSAGHCSVTAVDGSIEIQTEDGAILKRRVIAEDPNSDLLLIEGLPNVHGLNVAVQAKKFEHIRTFTHGHAMATYKTEGMLLQNVETKFITGEIHSKKEQDSCVAIPKYKTFNIYSGEVCILDVEETATSASIVPGSSGGMVVNSHGDLVGVASATDGYFGYLVRLSDIQAFLAAY